MLLVALPAFAVQEGELGTVSANCGGFGQNGISVRWDSGTTTREAPCPPAKVAPMFTFNTGDRVKRVGNSIVKVSAAPPPSPAPTKPPAPPKAASNKGTVTGLVVSVTLEDGTSREIRIPPGNDAVKIGDKVEVLGSQLKPAGR